MLREDLIDEWKKAAVSGSLLTPKHDPNNLSSIVMRYYRSVLTPNMSSSLQSFIESEEFTINRFHNPKFNNDYYEVIPKSKNFSITGLGVPSGSWFPSGSHDRLVFFSGSNQSWHVIAESSNTISSSVSNGSLNRLGTVI